MKISNLELDLFEKQTLFDGLQQLICSLKESKMYFTSESAIVAINAQIEYIQNLKIKLEQSCSLSE